MKVHFWEKEIRTTFGQIESFLLTVFSVVAIFVPFKDDCKCWVVISLVGVSVLLYLAIFMVANKAKKVKLTIRNTKIIIKEGDLFKEKGKKVIPCNDYFDTQVDDIIVAKGSLHGKFITSYVSNIDELKNVIKNELTNGHPNTIVDQKRQSENQIKFGVGTIIPFHDFLLLAYSRFDSKNKASLEGEFFSKCYTTLWKEIDRYRAAESICMPVLGAGGIVRFDQDYTAQQLLEMMLWSFRLSGVHLARQATLTIVVHKSTSSEINFWRLKNYSD